jgi:hypothetical protein
VHAVYPVWRDLARVLAPTVRVVAAVPSAGHAAAARELLAAAGLAPSRIDVVVAGEPMTLWARDAMVVSTRRGSPLFLVPSPEGGEASANGDAPWAGAEWTRTAGHDADVEEGEELLGDRLVAAALAAGIPGACSATLPMLFEGGNLVVTGPWIVAGEGLLEANPELSTAEVATLLRSELGGEPVFLGPTSALPHGHVDMYLAAIGPDAVLLGDPRLGEAYLARAARLGIGDAALPDFDRWTAAAQRRARAGYDLVEAELRRRGLRVHRVPALHGEDGGMLSWTNSLVEQRDGAVHAYVPAYGVPELDDQALRAYGEAGCQVAAIDASRLASLGGAVRCTTNVLAWRGPAGPAPR